MIRKKFMRKLPVSSLLILILGLKIVSPLDAGEFSVEEQRFRDTATIHINAIKNRDLNSLLSTITKNEKLTLIFPGGTTLNTRQEYIDFHIGWFADASWSMDIEPISYMVRGHYGVALVRTTYTDAAGSRQALLALSFSMEDGSWRLVFDQNTRVVSD